MLRCITSLDTKLVYKITLAKKFVRLFTCTINGTVTSGHPTRTTFGNTLRVIAYYEFIFEELGIQHYKFFVGGDDFYCIMLEKDVELLNRNVFKYYS